MSGGGVQQGVSLDSLNAQQLTSVKKQMDEEVDHLTTSFAQLQAAQIKFKDCLRCVKKQASTENEKEILVPLTNSLYVRGNLSSPDRVLVDVGTGFYIEKDVKRASLFYEDKIKELGGNIQDLETIVQNKTAALRAVEEVLRQKMVPASKSS